MPKGVYNHKPQQGFQKGHKIGVGNTNTLGKKIHTEEHKQELREKMTGNKWALGKTIGSNNGNWKGGLPDCIDCGKKVSAKGYTRCHACNTKVYVKEKVYNWKGGYENTKFLIAKRRLKKLGNGGNHTLLQWNELKKEFGYMCLCCKKVEPEIKLTEDHIIPISKGGSDNIENIQPLCQSCNSRKGVIIKNFIISYATK